MAHSPITGDNGVQRWRNETGNYYREDGPAQLDCFLGGASMEWMTTKFDMEGNTNARWTRFIQLANTRELAFDLLENGVYRERFYA